MELHYKENVDFFFKLLQEVELLVCRTPFHSSFVGHYVLRVVFSRDLSF